MAMGNSRGTTLVLLFVIYAGFSPALFWLPQLPAASAHDHGGDVLNSKNLPSAAYDDISHPDLNVERCTYTVTTVTGKRAEAGTDSVISLRMENHDGDSVYFSQLDNGKRHFQRGHKDKFVMPGACVSHICKLTMYTDNAFDSGAWFVETISYSVDTSTGPEHRTWDVHQWIPRDDDADELFYVVDDCVKAN